MQRIRHIESGDRSELASLWSLRFHDSPSFTEWFFTKRYCTAHSLCMEEGGRIVSVIHAWPMRLNIRTKQLPALMLCGVATLPAYERQGCMHRLMQALLNNARTSGFPLVFHKPNTLSTYVSLGQLPCTDSQHLRLKSGTDDPVFSDVWPVGRLLSVYRLATAGFSGCVMRDETAMRLKLADYRSDGARLILSDGGYAVLFEQEAGWYGEEVLASDLNTYENLLKLLPVHTVVKLPPNLPFAGERRPQNVMGAADISSLLFALCGDPSLIFEVSDPILPHNCGVFNGCGEPDRSAPMLSATAGELLQYLCGYRSHPLFSLQTCFCVDEY